VGACSQENNRFRDVENKRGVDFWYGGTEASAPGKQALGQGSNEPGRLDHWCVQ
jgi:hypothetical protein